MFAFLCGVGTVAAGLRIGWARGFLAGFDAGAFVFLLSLLPLLSDRKPEEVRRHADENSANRLFLLLLTSTVSMAILAAVAVEMGGRRSIDALAVGQVIVTLALAWLFSNSVYALHYAHLYYSDEAGSGGDHGGIDFPGTPDPGYWDFIYFSFTLGMTFQTSDSNVTKTRVRRTVILHSLAAFVFNIGVLAFSINVLGSLGGG